jgi:uncharacterized protein YyaL (SSP411 family)
MPTLATLVLLAHATAAAAPTSGDLYQRLCAHVAAAYDSSRGGFVSKSHVPSDAAVELALLRAEEADGATWKLEATTTLEWMHALMDTLNGGFTAGLERREGDMQLGKRADVNGRRLELLLAAASVEQGRGYRADAARVADFFERVLLDGRGGFVTAQVGDRDLVPAANGVAIHAWLTWAAARLDRGTRRFALRSLDRVWETCWDPTVGLVRRNDFGEIQSEPRLDDQVEMGRAFVLAAHTCGRPVDREHAVALGDLLLAKYQEGHAGFRTSAVPKKDGSIQRAGMDIDQNARAARFLAELWALTGNAAYRDAAMRAWTPFEKKEAKLGLDAAEWALAARAWGQRSLPEVPSWASAAEPEEPRARPRSVRIKLGH